MTHSKLDDLIQIADAPAIPGLRFRHFRGDEDFPRMVEIIGASMRADGQDSVPDTAEQIRDAFAHLHNSDPATDTLFIEVEGAPNDGLIGYSRVMWWQVAATQERVYGHFGRIHPD